jgi:hypothetical protein
MRNLNKILNYSLFIKPEGGIYIVRLKIQDLETPIEIKFSTIMELDAVATILRNETNTFYDTLSNTIVIEWEPIGENDPKYAQQHH